MSTKGMYERICRYRVRSVCALVWWRAHRSSMGATYHHHPQTSLPSHIRRDSAQVYCCQAEACCSCGYGDRFPGSRGQQGQEKSRWLGWGKQAGGQKETFKTLAQPTGEQWCVRASSVVSLPAYSVAVQFPGAVCPLWSLSDPSFKSHYRKA